MPTLERRLYGFPPPTRTRPSSKPLRLLALGLPRTTTEALAAALHHLSYTSVFSSANIPLSSPNYTGEAFAYLLRRKYAGTGSVAGDCKITARDFDLVLGDCDAVVDMPLACFAQELLAAYPEALVVLNSRDVDSWYAGYAATFGEDAGREWSPESLKGWGRSWFCAELYWLEIIQRFTQRVFFYGSFAANGKWVFRQHEAMVRGLCAQQGRKVLEWKAEDGWGPLCEFLGVEKVSEREFPRSSDVEVKKGIERVEKVLQPWNDRADQRLAVLVAVFSALIGITFGVIVFWLDLGAIVEKTEL